MSLSMIRYQNSLLPMFTFEMKPNWCLCFTNFESPFLWDCSEESLKLGIWFAARPTHTTQCPARVGSGQSRSEKWRKNAIHSLREVQVKKKWLEIEIEKWKWNENDWKSRSRSESEMKKLWDREVNFLRILENFWDFKIIADILCFGFCTLLKSLFFFMKLCVKFHYFFLEKMGEMFFSITLFEKWKWNRNDWKSRSRSEIIVTRDQEVKFKKKKFSRIETLAGHCHHHHYHYYQPLRPLPPTTTITTRPSPPLKPTQFKSL